MYHQKALVLHLSLFTFYVYCNFPADFGENKILLTESRLLTETSAREAGISVLALTDLPFSNSRLNFILIWKKSVDSA